MGSETERKRARDYYNRNKAACIVRAAVWGKAHPEKTKLRRAAYYAAHKEKFKEYGARWKEAHPGLKLALNRKRQLGIDRNEQDVLLKKDCAICGKKSTHIDHNHVTGRVRAALCRNCNTGLGMFGDDQDRLLRAARYIIFHTKTKEMIHE